MVTMTTTVFRKASLLTLGLACAFGVIMAVGAKTEKSPTGVQAATVETKRVWMKNSIASDWDKDSAKTYIHIIDGSAATAWPGTPVLWDAANSLVYFDISSDTTTYMFVRCSAAGAYWSAKTNNLSYSDSVGKYYDLTGPIAWDPNSTSGSFVSFAPVATSIVTNFVATFDTQLEACSSSAAQVAINSYNALSTFEQDQFDALDVGEGFTGLQRLNYLKSYYGISTLLNANNVSSDSSTKNSLLPILILGIIGLSAISGFYIVSKKKKYD